jgi:hypothetical protein
MRNFTKLRPVEVALFHADRGMDKDDKAKSFTHRLCKAHKNETTLPSNAA